MLPYLPKLPSSVHTYEPLLTLILIIPTTALLHHCYHYHISPLGTCLSLLQWFWIAFLGFIISQTRGRPLPHLPFR